MSPVVVPTMSHLVPVPGGAVVEVLVDRSRQPPAGPAVVLLPSSLRDATDLGELACLLAAAGCPVLRPQPRGMGRSSAPPDTLSLHLLADDVARAIDVLADGPALVAGHAFGHFVARVLDLDHPQRVRGVAVLAAAARQFPPGLVDALDIAADANQPVAARLASLRHAFFAPGNDASVWLSGWHPHLRDVYRRAGAIPAKDRWWPVSHAPILDLQAALDPWRPPVSRNELKDQLGDKVTVRVIPHASHALVTEQAAAVAAAIVEWAGTLP
ncbi:alpha/beta hydrolase [Comamonadaceae bacterium G21597-S1]|nr:alpha/beta hydrolase [Comamonadaceae bacterium G21597-S1]